MAVSLSQARVPYLASSSKSWPGGCALSFLNSGMQVPRCCDREGRDKQKYKEPTDGVHVCDHNQNMSNTGGVNEKLRRKKKAVCISE